MASKHDIARLFFAAALAVASVAHAGEAWADAQGSTGTSATATVGFRITIREVLRLDGQMQHLHATAPTTSRTLTIEHDRQVVTLARP